MKLEFVNRTRYSSTITKVVDSNKLLALALILILGTSFTIAVFVRMQLEAQPEETADESWNYPNDPTPNVTLRQFANYTEYGTSYILNAPQYELSSSLSNVINLGDVTDLTEWSMEVANVIESNYFAAVPGGVYTSDSPPRPYRQFSEIYDDNYWDVIPSFITADSVLHTFHMLYDQGLRIMEVNNYTIFLDSLIGHMLEESLEQYNTLDQEWWKDCALRNLAYFSVAAKLLNPLHSVSAIVSEWVNDVVDQIESESSMESSWFMDQHIDFSLFTPRGHYTRTIELENYFKTMVWFGSISFRIQPDDFWNSTLENQEKGFRESAQAVLMCKALQGNSAILSEGGAFTLWEGIYEPTSFLVGTADDLTPHEYCQVLSAVYRADCNVYNLQNMTRLQMFMDIALELRDPRILGNWMPDFQQMEVVTKGMRFMGQRFVPDSFIFWKLVEPNVSDRLIPTGLDIMSVFGSEHAADLIIGESAQYYNQSNILRGYFSNLSLSNWTQNIYWSWIHSFLPLLENRTEGYPSFMTSETWADKQVFTALGSWTELRHDTVLYAKQSVTGWLSGVPDHIPGYVEPVPKLYSRLASLCTMLREGLTERSLLNYQLEYKLPRLENLLLTLKSIAEKELSNVTLSEDELSTMKHYGGILRSLERFDDNCDRAALVADVHTDPNTMSVLEEATGDPMVIFVAVPTMSGEPYITRGAMYSYYEFTMPIDERMTDETWWEIVDAGDEPPFPDWAFSFIISDPPAFSQHISEVQESLPRVEMNNVSLNVNSFIIIAVLSKFNFNNGCLGHQYSPLQIYQMKLKLES